MSSGRRFRSTANVLVAIFLTAGLILGIGLVVLGGGSDKAPAEAPKSSNSSTPTAPRRELPLDDLSAGALTKLTGLVFPTAMTDFLTAELEGGSQLDITFVMATELVADFVKASGLPKPAQDKRLILHSSPLWKLNPEEDTTLSSAQDDHGEVHRVVELLTNNETGADQVRARIVITPN
ncbi:MAG: hypothetical protein WBA45_14035 [Microthrixaceae bacterium]